MKTLEEAILSTVMIPCEQENRNDPPSDHESMQARNLVELGIEIRENALLGMYVRAVIEGTIHREHSTQDPAESDITLGERVMLKIGFALLTSGVRIGQEMEKQELTD